MIKHCDTCDKLATHDRANGCDPSDPDIRMNMCPECLKGDRYEDVQRLPGTVSLRLKVAGFDQELVIHVPEGHGLSGDIGRHGLQRAVKDRVSVEEVQ
jgi:hypothetical protein